MNTMLHTLKENKLIASVLLTLLAATVVAFVAWPSGSANETSAQEVSAQQTSTQAQAENHSSSEESYSGEGEHEGEGNHEGGPSEEVHLSADQRSSLGIQTEKLTASSASSGMKRPATITFNPDRVARIGPRVNAKVTRVLADLGDWVERGEAVAVMNSMKLGTAKSSYLTAKARLATARAAYEREQKLRAKDISSEAELLEAKSQFQEAQSEVDAAAETLRLYDLSNSEIQNLESGSDQPASQFVLRSPISGTVQQRDVSPGQSVSASETPIHVANAGEMWAMIDAYERDVPVLKEGQDVTLSVRGLPGQTFRGQIDFVSSQLDEETRTVRARAVIDNENRQLRSGMFGTAKIDADSAAATYPMISVDAVQDIGERKMVFVPGEEDGAFRATRVQTGAETESGLVAITSGLKPGGVAVTQGAFDLKSVLTSSSRSGGHH